MEDTDVAVTNRDDRRLEASAVAAGAGYVGPERLRQLLLYAIDRERREALVRRYVGRPRDPGGAPERASAPVVGGPAGGC